MIERADSAREVPGKVFIGMGGDEHLPGSGFYDRDSRRHVEAARALAASLEGRARVEVRIADEHRHDEHAWAERLPAALVFLFGND